MSKMLEAINALRKTVVEFHNYLCLTKDHTPSWQRDPIQTMIENAVSTTRKLDKLSRIVGEHRDKPEMQHQLAEKVYGKLIEYVARLQEAITGCMLREKNNNNLPYCEFLMDLTMRVDQILLKPNNFYFTLPKKDWLTVEQMQANLITDQENYSNISNPKAVIFRELRWPSYNVTGTTQQIELAKKEQLEEKEWLKKILAEIKEQNKPENNKLSAKL